MSRRRTSDFLRSILRWLNGYIVNKNHAHQLMAVGLGIINEGRDRRFGLPMRVSLIDKERLECSKMRNLSSQVDDANSSIDHARPCRGQQNLFKKERSRIDGVKYTQSESLVDGEYELNSRSCLGACATGSDEVAVWDQQTTKSGKAIGSQTHVIVGNWSVEARRQ